MESINATTKPETACRKYQEQEHKPGLYLGLFHGHSESAKKWDADA